MQNIDNLLPWPLASNTNGSNNGSTTTGSANHICSRVVVVRDTYDANGTFLLNTMTNMFTNNAQPDNNANTNNNTTQSNHEPHVIWLSGQPSTQVQLKALLNKFHCTPSNFKFANIIADYINQLSSSSDSTSDSSEIPNSTNYLKTLYLKLKKIITDITTNRALHNKNILIVIDDASSIANLLSIPIFEQFVKYLATLTYNYSSTSLLIRVGADKHLKNQVGITTSSTTATPNTNSVKAGTAECKWLGFGGLVGATQDEESSSHLNAFEDYNIIAVANGKLAQRAEAAIGGKSAGGGGSKREKDSKEKEEGSGSGSGALIPPQQQITTSTLGDFTPLTMLASPSGAILSYADLIVDVTPLKSGFSREVTGGVWIWCRGGGRGLSNTTTSNSSSSLSTSLGNVSSCSCCMDRTQIYRNQSRQSCFLKSGPFLQLNYHITDSGGDVKAVKLSVV